MAQDYEEPLEDDAEEETEAEEEEAADPGAGGNGKLPELVNRDPQTKIQKSVEEIVEDIRLIAGDKDLLVSVAGVLNGYDEAARKTFPMLKADDLFGFLTSVCRPAFGKGSPTKGEFLSAAPRFVPQYLTDENHPHFPTVPNTLYLCDQVEPEDNGALDGFVGGFLPATEVDRQLIKTFVLQTYWGGPCGARPIIVIESETGEYDPDGGRGYGKTKLAEFVLGLTGEPYRLLSTSSPERVRSDLLTPGNKYRSVFLDNAKTFKMASENIESMVTSSSIGGHVLFKGGGSKPNRLTWVITANAMQFGKDLADRGVIIRLEKADHSNRGWESQMLAYWGDPENRAALVADVAWHLLVKESSDVTLSDRWGPWVSEVLCKTENPDASLEVILARREGADGDSKLRSAYFEHLTACMKNEGHDALLCSLRIPSVMLTQWLFAMDKRTTTGSVDGIVKQYLGPWYRRHDTNALRGFDWDGPQVTAGTQRWQLEYRVEKKNGRSDYGYGSSTPPLVAAEEG
ncbi:MAG TPA: hypothetical protein VGJ05_04965 [Fimbriiglobus sp.]|jgi:hypothetical protein